MGLRLVSNDTSRLRNEVEVANREQDLLRRQLQRFQASEASVWKLIDQGAGSLTELRELAITSPDPEVVRLANDGLGKITGSWGSQVDLIWKRSLYEAMNLGKPIVLLQLFGRLDEPVCDYNGQMARNVVFAEESLVAYLEEHFVAAWESVSELSQVSKHPEQSSELPGVLSGDIAVYFCRPDGQVLDILPGLNSPETTLAAMKAVVDLYDQSNRGQDVECILDYHQAKLESLIELNSIDTPSVEELALRSQIGSLAQQLNELRVLAHLPIEKLEPISMTPKFTYKREVHERFTNVRRLRSPEQWKATVFEAILRIPLDARLGEPAHWEDGLVLLD